MPSLLRSTSSFCHCCYGLFLTLVLIGYFLVSLGGGRLNSSAWSCITDVQKERSYHGELGRGHQAGRRGYAEVSNRKVQGLSGEARIVGHQHHWQVGGVWPGSGSGDTGRQHPGHGELAYNATECELCSADSGSCRHGRAVIGFCVLETSLW